MQQRQHFAPPTNTKTKTKTKYMYPLKCLLIIILMRLWKLEMHVKIAR